MLKGILLIAAATIGGIYLTSDEGKQTRANLLKKKSIFEPIIKDIFVQSTQLLNQSNDVSAEDIQVNIRLLIKEAQKVLNEIDFEKTVETIREAIKVASRKIREAGAEIEKDTYKNSSKSNSVKTTSSNTKTKSTKTN